MLHHFVAFCLRVSDPLKQESWLRLRSTSGLLHASASPSLSAWLTRLSTRITDVLKSLRSQS